MKKTGRVKRDQWNNLIESEPGTGAFVVADVDATSGQLTVLGEHPNRSTAEARLEDLQRYKGGYVIDPRVFARDELEVKYFVKGPRCYACDAVATGTHSNSLEPGNLLPACDRHAEQPVADTRVEGARIRVSHHSYSGHVAEVRSVNGTNFTALCECGWLFTDSHQAGYRKANP